MFDKRKGAKFKSAGANNFLSRRRDSTFEFSDWHRFLPSKAVEREIVQRAWNGRPCAVNLIPLSTTRETAWQRRLFDFSNKIPKGVRKKRETSVKNRNRRLSGFSFVSFYFSATGCLAYSTSGKGNGGMIRINFRSKRWQVNGLMRVSSLLSQPHPNVNASSCKLVWFWTCGLVSGICKFIVRSRRDQWGVAK